jgi:hypothetical protein
MNELWRKLTDTTPRPWGESILWGLAIGLLVWIGLMLYGYLLG